MSISFTITKPPYPLQIDKTIIKGHQNTHYVSTNNVIINI